MNAFCRIIVTSKEAFHIVHIGKVGFGSAMRTYDMYDDAHNLYEHEEDAMGENVRVGNVDTESNGRRFQETSPDFVATMC